MRMNRLLILLLTLLLVLPCFLSCARNYKFDPGFYEINKENYMGYLKINIEKGKEDFPQARDTLYIEYEIESREALQYMGGFITIKFIANEQSITEKISLDENGKATGSVLMTFAKSYTVEYNYEIVDVSATLYDDGMEAGTAYIVYNNIRYEGWRGASWEPVYKKRNNSETLYFTDTIYTESGVAIDFNAASLFLKGYVGFWSYEPMDKVKTLIFDGTLKYSDFNKMSWNQVHKTMPNLQTIYIKTLIDDEASLNLYDMALPTSGVDFYIGGDVEEIAEALLEVDFVNSINSAEVFDLSKYGKDNKR